MINIYEFRYGEDTGSEPIVYIAKNKKDARAFIGNAAHDLNYGLVRHWVSGRDTGEPHYTYDCGPVTYFTTESIEEKEVI